MHSGLGEQALSMLRNPAHVRSMAMPTDQLPLDVLMPHGWHKAHTIEKSLLQVVALRQGKGKAHHAPSASGCGCRSTPPSSHALAWPKSLFDHVSLRNAVLIEVRVHLVSAQ
mmetsp:Transcript_65208/g.190792  ORF Transcript_65208/g.190792 Transcript_65208/m.190792 type:complete len:112 (-) Transcript_65208:1443-1778(-)